MPLIPTEARATIAAYREGRTEEQFIKDIWERRQVEHPVLKGRKPRGQWPITRAEDLPANVTPIKRKVRS